MNEHVLMPEGLVDNLLLDAASGNLPTSALMKGKDPIAQVGLANFSFSFFKCRYPLPCHARIQNNVHVCMSEQSQM